MFERIKKAIRKREAAKKRQEIERAQALEFEWHWFMKFGNEDYTGFGTIKRSSWKRWFYQLIKDGIVYDVESSSYRRVNGVLVSKYIKYKVSDMDRFDTVSSANGWKKRNWKMN